MTITLPSASLFTIIPTSVPPWASASRTSSLRLLSSSLFGAHILLCKGLAPFIHDKGYIVCFLTSSWAYFWNEQFNIIMNLKDTCTEVINARWNFNNLEKKRDWIQDYVTMCNIYMASFAKYSACTCSCCILSLLYSRVDRACVSRVWSEWNLQTMASWEGSRQGAGRKKKGASKKRLRISEGLYARWIKLKNLRRARHDEEAFSYLLDLASEVDQGSVARY